MPAKKATFKHGFCHKYAIFQQKGQFDAHHVPWCT